MSFFRLTAPRAATPENVALVSESLFARMVRLWIERNERVAQFQLLDR